MNSARSIEYFRRLNLRLWQDEGRKRGAWHLSPFGKEAPVKDFPSLKEAWIWWKRMIQDREHNLESVEIASELACADPVLRDDIYAWADSGGSYWLGADTMVDIYTPHIAGQRVDIEDFYPRGWVYRQAAHDAWPRPENHLPVMIAQRLREVFARELSASTPPTANGWRGVHRL